jgi:hypothetical protein
VLAVYALQAQNITTEKLSWHVFYVNDMNTGGQVLSENEKLDTYGSERIEWYDADGSIKNTFQVNKISGTWSNVSNNGYIIYQVTRDSKSGTLTFERSKNEIMIRILLVEGRCYSGDV